MRLKTLLLSAALLVSLPGWSQAVSTGGSLPYYNPGDDLETVTTSPDGSNQWVVYDYYPATQEKAFSVQPSSTSTSYASTATLWTKSLAVKSGSVYKLTLVMGPWTSRAQSKGEVALYASPSVSAAKSVLFSQENMSTFNNNNRPSYTIYFKGDPAKPYLGVGNRGGGSIGRFGVDDIRVIEIDPQTPAAPKNLKATASGKDIAISVTLPSANVVGDALTGIQSVRLLRDGKLIHEWTGQTPGATLTYDDNASTNGTYTYTVVCSNNGFDGDSATASVTVGGDAKDPSIQLSALEDPDGNKWGSNYAASTTWVPGQGIKLKWAPYYYTIATYPRQSYPNPEEGAIYYYTVTRLNDGKVLAERTTDLELIDSDALTAGRSDWQYFIQAHYSYQGVDKTEDYCNSSILSIHNPVPFAPSMSKASINEFTAIDADRNGSNWAYNNPNKSHGDVPYFYVQFQGDDWLISPGLDLTPGTTYRIDVDAFSGKVDANVQLGVYTGTSNTIEAMTTKIMPETLFMNQLPATLSSFYTVPEDSDGKNIFFALRSLDPAGFGDPTNTGVSAFIIKEASPNVPLPVEDVNVVYAADLSKATLEFTAPSENISGGDLESLSKIEIQKNGEAFKTVQNPVPGKRYSEDVDFDLGTEDEYTFTAFTEDSSLPVSVKVMILRPPYSNTYDKQSDMAGYTVINPNMTGYTWSYNAVNKAMQAYPHRESGHNEYLVMPPMHLEKGSWYKIDFRTWLATPDDNYYYDNELEVLIGKAPTVEALTDTIMKPFYVRGGFNSREYVKGWFTVPETGEYYIAWHTMSDPLYGQGLFLDDVEISSPIPGTYPGPVTDYKVAPDPEGALQTTVSFKLPEKTLDGDPLGSNKVYEYKIFCDLFEIANGLSQTPGSEITFTHKNVPQGIHLYTVTCYGAKDEPTIDMDELVYVGINRPSRVEFVEVEENPDKFGEVTITWGPPTLDIDGFPLNTSKITYTVGEYKYNNVTGEAQEVLYADGLTDLSYTKVVKSENATQEFMRFFVRANTTAGKGTPTVLSSWMAVGKPFTLPFKESFPNSNFSHTMMSQALVASSWAQWGFNRYNPATGVYPVDGDNGLAMMECPIYGHGSRLYTARVNLNVENPVITFYVYNQSTSDKRDENTLGISLREGNGEFFNVATKTIDEWAGGNRGWQKATLDLSEYAGKTWYIGFDGFSLGYLFIHLDNIVVDTKPDTDLAAQAISNEKVYVGVEHNITVNVKNNGAKEVEGAQVKLRLDNKFIDTKELPKVAPGAIQTVTFTNVITRDQVGNHWYGATVEVEGDNDTDDNTVQGASFSVETNSFPTVQNLQAESVEGETVSLSWEAPYIPEEAQEIEDDFESYNSWSTIETGGVGNYTLIDNDGYAVGGFQGIDIPNIPYGSKQGFSLWDFTLDVFSEDTHYRAHSGDKCLVSMYNPGEYDWTDDWLISPRLTGNAQTITFWAKALSDDRPEQFYVMYSTGGMDLKEFEAHNFGKITAFGDWQKYTYELPAGANYFAIQHYSKGGYFFFVDDLTYTPVGDETLALKGYNVYRGGEMLNDGLVPLTSFSEKAPEGQVEYAVSAVYDRGESPSVTILYEYIKEDTGVGMTTANVKISVEGSEIVISGAEGLPFTVANTSGIIVTSRVAETPVIRIPVSAGVYVVRVADKSVKVIVG